MTGKKALVAGTAALACGALIAAPAAPASTLSKGKTKVFSSNEPIATGAAKRISKKKLKVNTKSTAVSIASGTSASAPATCTGKTHMTGGGFAVAPSHVPPASGLRSLNPVSHPDGTKSWNAAGTAFTSPGGSGTFTSYVQCEGNALGKLFSTVTGTTTLAQGIGGVLVFNCAPSTHVISGGYSGTPPVTPNQLNGSRIIVLQSQRTGPGQWTVAGFNNPAPNVPNTATLTGYAVCEKDGKRQTVTEAATVAPIGDNVRSAADATCLGKKHVVSGGFLASPAVFPGPALFFSLDESNPVDKKGWHVGGWEYPGVATPAGANLATYSYCKKDPPKQK